ncbi:hypothetical protein [Algoriphagus mannitolivorans]|uniref:hypothetical protein n=1 Tax=Algoriphagus mannitolivorans TaxID=226504 RepID=UPI0003F657F1|nr:hypothetical protein [Algoriphagus mannitolivorans]
MIPNNISKLIDAIINKTEAKKAIWGKTSRNEEFKLFLEKGAVTTDTWVENGIEAIDFAIYNSYGDKIDNFVAYKGDDDFDILSRLHNTAKREFFKVDETIENLFKELNDPKSVGKRQIEDDTPLPF